LSRGVIAATFRSALQATPFAARLPRLIHAAAQGDYAPLAAFVVEVRKAGEAAVSAGIMLSVLCVEDAPLFESENTSDTLMGSYWKKRLKGGMRGLEGAAAEDGVPFTDGPFHPNTHDLRLPRSGDAARSCRSRR